MNVTIKHTHTHTIPLNTQSINVSKALVTVLSKLCAELKHHHKYLKSSN